MAFHRRIKAFAFPAVVWGPTANEMTTFFIDVERALALLISSCVFQVFFFYFCYLSIWSILESHCVWDIATAGDQRTSLVYVLLRILGTPHYIYSAREWLVDRGWPFWPCMWFYVCLPCVCVCVCFCVHECVKMFLFFIFLLLFMVFNCETRASPRERHKWACIL